MPFTVLEKTRGAEMTKVIHEMSSYSQHMKSLGGELHSFFAKHPMIRSHRAPLPEERDQVHFIYLSDDRQGFKVLVSEGAQDGEGSWLSIQPDGEFRDACIQSVAKSHYIVSVDRYPHHRGPLAVDLVDSFVVKYDATNLTIW